MKPYPRQFNTIDEYIADCPPEIQKILEEIRATIRNAAPEAQEVISYHMPAFKFHGILVYFAACKNHIGFYPTASGIETFKDRLTDYKSSKGAVQFSIDQPMPLVLISEITRFRAIENLEKAKNKVVRAK